MSRTVWKYEVPIDDQWHEVTIPAPARMLHADTQGSNTSVFVWVEVTPDSAEHLPQRLRVFGTGQPIPPRSSYIDSTIAGGFAWHLYGEAPGMFGKYEDPE